MVLKFINLKQKIVKLYWSIDNMKRTGFTGYVFDFSVDYEATDVDDIKVFDEEK